jgi:hypothetical protein
MIGLWMNLRLVDGQKIERAPTRGTEKRVMRRRRTESVQNLQKPDIDSSCFAFGEEKERGNVTISSEAQSKTDR